MSSKYRFRNSAPLIRQSFPLRVKRIVVCKQRRVHQIHDKHVDGKALFIYRDMLFIDDATIKIGSLRKLEKKPRL
jgi:hypothetical protein